MKKTKILLVLAIAMLAMFAMSACTLVAQGIERVEFTSMPKAYYAEAELDGAEEGITVAMKVVIAGQEHSVNVTVNGDGTYVVPVAGFNVDVTVKNFGKTMGEYNLIVTAENTIAEFTYRVLEEVAMTADAENDIVTLDTAVANGGYYLLTESIVGKDRFEVLADTFVLYGAGHSVTTEERGEDTRVFDINNTVNGNNVDNGFFEFNNVVVNDGYDSGDYTQRGINVAAVGAIVNINASDISGKYAINFPSVAADLTVNISNGTTSKGWAALNAWGSGCTFNIDDVSLQGVNQHTGASNSFSTICFYGHNNVVNISNCELKNETLTEQAQFLIMVQNKGTKNIISVENCTDENGEKIGMFDNLCMFMEKLPTEIDGRVLEDNDDAVEDKTLWNKLYIDGVLYMAEDLFDYYVLPDTWFKKA